MVSAPRPEFPATDPNDQKDPPGGDQAKSSPAASHPAGEPSDHELIRMAQAGDEYGFAQLVRRHEDRATRVAWGLIANREDARDLAQEAFLRVFRNLDRFDFRHEFTTWLYRIVTNLAIDHLRKRRPKMSTTIQGEEGETEIELTDDRTDLPWEAMDREETGRKVRICIDRLAPHFQTVMVLRELEGLPCTEIAEIVGATHVTVRWRLHRGRKLFQEEWERMERALERGTPLPEKGSDESANSLEEPPV
jgi:RNA polymerase sigma-70 factor (ECF subfamily)